MWFSGWVYKYLGRVSLTRCPHDNRRGRDDSRLIKALNVFALGPTPSTDGSICGFEQRVAAIKRTRRFTSASSNNGTPKPRLDPSSNNAPHTHARKHTHAHKRTSQSQATQENA